MFTPQQVSEKSFPKSSFGGYNMASVDEFLDELTEDYAALYKENATLKAKLKVLAEKVEEYRATEDAMRSTLLTAQRMAAQMVEDAKAEKETILAEAYAQAGDKVAELKAETAAAEAKLSQAQAELAAFLQRGRDLCRTQLAFLEQLPELDVPAEEERAEEDEVTQDTIRIIEQDIMATFAAQEAVQAPVEETAAQVEPEEKSEQESESVPAAEEEPFPADFKLDLNELKFGRNYTGE